MALLTKAILNSITNALYVGAAIAFYSVSPTAGEVLITTLTEGFVFVRERKAGAEIDGSGVTAIIAGDASITPTQLKVAGVAVITIGSSTTRYAIVKCLPQQQLGAGYILRLAPQKGAAG